VPPPAVA